MATTEVERSTGVDVEDVPSAEWGWSKMNRAVIQAGGILSAIFLLVMLRGNHVGHVEDAWLIGFAILLLVIVVRGWWLRRRGWIRCPQPSRQRPRTPVSSWPLSSAGPRRRAPAPVRAHGASCRNGRT